MKYTVRQGCRYAARISLSGFEVLASNDDISERLRSIGFVDIDVSGSGGTRIAHGTWPNADKSADLPSEITEVKQLITTEHAIPGGGKALEDG